MDIYFSLASQCRTTKDREPVSTTEYLHFVYGRQEFFRLKIFDFEKIKTDSQIVCWDALVYDGDDSEMICHTVDSEIDSSENTEGLISFCIVTKTEKFRDKTRTGNIHGWMEVRGLNSDGAIACCMKFRCVGEYANDLSDNVPVELVDDIATKSWVKNILSGSNADSFVTQEMLSAAISEQPIKRFENSTIQIAGSSVAKHNITENDVITFDALLLGEDRCITMELWLTMPEEVVSFSIPDVTWIEEPSFDTANMLYCVVLRWDGEKVLANLAYSVEVS